VRGSIFSSDLAEFAPEFSKQGSSSYFLGKYQFNVANPEHVCFLFFPQALRSPNGEKGLFEAYATNHWVYYIPDFSLISSELSHACVLIGIDPGSINPGWYLLYPLSNGTLTLMSFT